MKNAVRIPLTLSLLLALPIAASESPSQGHLRYIEVPVFQASIKREGAVPAELPTSPPVIDGRLGDPIWRIAAVSSNFWISAQNRPPTEKTEVLVIQDAENLYFGFRMYDSVPGSIRATREIRDTGLGYDDSIEVQLDTFLNRRDISTFSVNVLGTQSDEIAGGRSSKIEWKGDWGGAAARTEYGWSAEFAIPFSILNYQKNAEAFGVNFRRYQNRTNEYSYWADVSPQYLNERMGQLRELTVPNMSRSQPWTFMPFALIGKNIPDKRGDIQDNFGTAGIDMRYQPRQDFTGLVSLNPDFSQVEQAVTDISFSYSEKAVDENRPFFVEGADYFSDEKDDEQYFYSNRLADFDVGAKAFGRAGRTNFGMLLTQAPDDRMDFAGRAQYELDATNSAIVTLVGTAQDEFDNMLAVGQFRGRQPSGLNYAFDGALTSTGNVTNPEVVEGKGSHYSASIGWDSDYWYASVKGDKYDVEYFPANALLDDDLPGTRGTSTTFGYSEERGNAFWRSIEGYVGAKYRETDSGELQTRSLYASGAVELISDVRLGLYAEQGPYRPVTDTVGVFEDELNHDRLFSATLDLNTRSYKYSGGIQYDWGDLGGGTYEYASAYAWWRPINSVYLEVSAERENSFGTSDQVIFVSSWDITPEDALAGRYISNADGDYYRVAFGRKARKGLDIFAVFDKQPFDKAQYSLKLVYTFQH